MLPVLTPLKDTALAPHLGRVHLSDGRTAPAGVTVDALREPAFMAELVRRFRPDAWSDAPRAAFSFWTQYYFLRLLPPVVVANLLFGRELPLALAEVAVTIGDDGLPSAFLVRNPGAELSADVSAAERFRGLREAHLAPLIAAWSAQTRLSPRLFWSNVERYLTWLLDGLQAFEAGQHAEPLRRWLADPEAGAPGRPRPCCLRDHLPNVPVCGDCPKLRRSRDA
jgi:ferric iron reductase protein FhuF